MKRVIGIKTPIPANQDSIQRPAENMEHFKDSEYSIFLMGVGRFRSRWAAMAWLRKHRPERWENLDYEICEVWEYPGSGITLAIEEGIEIGDRPYDSDVASWERFKEEYSQKGYKLD